MTTVGDWRCPNSIPKANGGHLPPASSPYPGSVQFMDNAPNPAKGSLTPSTSFLNHPTVVDDCSQHFVFIGVQSTKAEGVAQAVNHFAVHHRPRMDFTPSDVRETHADAGTVFLLDEFQSWVHKRGIDVVAAALHHQEMNGMPKTLWRLAQLMDFKMMTTARHGLFFFHFALFCEWQMFVALPSKSTN